MPLPFELTTFPKAAHEILIYLAQQQNGAFDEEMKEALGLSERSFRKAIRRLVTKEYVEMQFNGPYMLTRRGERGAAALLEAGEDAPSAETPPGSDQDPENGARAFTRRLLVVYPRTVPASRPAYLFVRVDAPPGEPDSVRPVDIAFRVQSQCAVDPDQREATIPPDNAAPAARFAITAPDAGKFPVTVEAYQIGELDLMQIGEFDVVLTAGAVDAPPDTFFITYFTLALQG